MAQIDILKDVLEYSLRKFEHFVIGSDIYFTFNNERYAVAKLLKVENRNEYNGISIEYVSKLFGVVHQCDIQFKDVFLDSKHASINIPNNSDTYDWYEKRQPTPRDLNKLAEHVERYFHIIGDFGDYASDYMGVAGLATRAAYQGIANQTGFLPGQTVPVVSSPEVSALSPNEIEEDVYENEEAFIEEQEVPLHSPDTEEEDTIESFSEEDAVSPMVEEEMNSPLQNEEAPLEENPGDVVSESSDADDGVISDVAEEDKWFEKNEETKEISKEMMEEDALVSPEDDPVHEIPDCGPVVIEQNAKESTGKRSVFGGFFSKKKKEKAPRVLKVQSSTKQEEPVYELPSMKPLAEWNIGLKKEKDVTASLHKIEDGNYRLVISGKGRMQNFKSAPWTKYIEQIAVIEIEEGVSSIGNNAFKSFSLIQSVELPDSIEEIGMSAFEFCDHLESIKWSQRLKVICDFAFAGTDQLKETVLPDSLEEIRDFAFDFRGDFALTYVEPKRLHLGAGISPSNFEKPKHAPVNISVDDYV